MTLKCQSYDSILPLKRTRRSAGNDRNQKCWLCSDKDCEKWLSYDNNQMPMNSTGDHEAFNPP